MYGGPATNTVFGGGSNFNGNTVHYQIFDVIQPCILKSVKLFTNSAGNRTIELRDAAWCRITINCCKYSCRNQTVTLKLQLNTWQ